jgi:protocatechuate 3,4-dioxygenase beta subunit
MANKHIIHSTFQEA